MDVESISLLSTEELSQHLNSDTLLLDTRSAYDFADGHIAGSLSIPFGDRFDELVHKMLSPDRKCLLIMPNEDQEKIENWIADSKFSNIVGIYLFENDILEIFPADIVVSIGPEEFELDFRHDKSLLLYDLRTADQFELSHLKGSVNKSMHELIEAAGDFKENEVIYILSENGDESMAFISFMKMKGIHSLRHISGGKLALPKEGLDWIEPKKKKKSNS